jgi:hypothetical protein
MSDIGDFPSDQITVIRIPAIVDLGVVHQGDHLVVIPGRGVVAVDTRRDPPEPIWRAGPATVAVAAARPKKTRVDQPQRNMPDVELRQKLATFTQERAIEILRVKGSATTMEIADAMGADRNNSSMRDRVKRLVRLLRDRGIIVIQGRARRNHTRYVLRERSGADHLAPTGVEKANL